MAPFLMNFSAPIAILFKCDCAAVIGKIFTDRPASRDPSATAELLVTSVLLQSASAGP